MMLLQGSADGGRYAAGVTVLCTAMTLFSHRIQVQTVADSGVLSFYQMESVSAVDGVSLCIHDVR